jgi:hypothetical protein
LAKRWARHPVLAAESPRGVAGVLPLVFFRSQVFGTFTVSLPFVNYGGVLADNAVAAGALLDAAIAATRRWRHAPRAAAHHPAVREPGRQAPQGGDATAAGRNPDQWRRSMQVTQPGARVSALSAQSGDSARADFYTVFARNMRDLRTSSTAAGSSRRLSGASPDLAFS